MFRASLSGFSVLGTRQAVPAEISGPAGELDATRTLDVANRSAVVSADAEISLDAQAFSPATPDYLVPGMRRFGLSGFSVLGTLQSRPAAVDVASGTMAAGRDAIVLSRQAAVSDLCRGYVTGVSIAKPDLSGSISVEFEEVYSI